MQTTNLFAVTLELMVAFQTENTKFYEKLVSDHLQLPPLTKPQNGTTDLPYVYMGDEAFTLRQDFLKPFAQNDQNVERKIFNYRLSRARRIVENF
jgi:hypothetical protein